MFQPKAFTIDELLSYTIRDEDTECLYWLGVIDRNGYAVANGYHRLMNQSGHQFAHRVAYCLKHNVSITSNDLVLHSCDEPACINPDHLVLGDHADNHKQKARRGRAGKKLTLEQVRTIRELYSGGNITYMNLALTYNVTEHTISNVIRRKFWAEV